MASWTEIEIGATPEESIFIPVALPEMIPLMNGNPVVWATNGEGKIPIGFFDHHKTLTWSFDIASWLNRCRNQFDREPLRPIYTRIPGFNVNHIPAKFRTWIFKTMFKSSAAHADLKRSYGIDRLLFSLRGQGFDLDELLQFTPPCWPDGKKSALVLTFDVDSDYIFEGKKNPLLSLLEDYDFCGAWFFLTGKYPLPEENLLPFVGRGQEIGWHGHNHDHRMAFANEAEREARISKALSFFSKYRASGMRADHFLWSQALFKQVLPHLKYDTSFVDAFPFSDSRSGCATAIPFEMENGLWQIPTTVTPDCFLPEDWNDEAWFDLQKSQIDWLIQAGGVIHILAHPEPTITLHPRRLALFQRVLKYLSKRKSELWNVLPKDLQIFMKTYRENEINRLKK